MSKALAPLQQYTSDIERLCRLHKVKALYAFGSVLSDRFTDESDIDMIVDFEDVNIEEYADNYFDFKFSLEDMFNRKVDLLEQEAIKNPYFLQHVNQQKQLVYGH